MFSPVSRITYQHHVAEGQVLVCGSPPSGKWESRAAAVFMLTTRDAPVDVVRDILANPQIRALVLDNAGPAGEDIRLIWKDTSFLTTVVSKEHLSLVRGFVDLFDDDYRLFSKQPPFWPRPIIST